MTAPREFTAGFICSGLGAGALGFIEALGRMGPDTGKFRSLGGIDNDAEACADFETLTGSPAMCADISTVTPEQLRAAWGERRPDCIFTSPPCKGFSGLLSAANAQLPKYQALNELVYKGFFLVCETWEEVPPLIVLENVPRIQTRGAEVLAKVRQLLGHYGYVFHEGNHDCGEVGGLAQHRRRFLMVARQPKSVTAYVYKPPHKRVKACGEVLQHLPMPEDDGAGRLHQLPRVSWLNWVRLAMIPAGGDWRDLPKAGGVNLTATAENASSFKGRPGLFGVMDWEEPSPTVTGRASISGGTTMAAIADPRLRCPVPDGAQRRSVFARYDLRSWLEPARTVAGPGVNGGFGVADPRVGELRAKLPLGCSPRSGTMGVLDWQQAAATITGSGAIDNGPFAVADPRDPPQETPIIVAQDGTWHRPMTTLEFAALQGLPTTVGGSALQLAGRRQSAWRERIGNAVPVGAAKAIAESLLMALVATAVGGWCLGGTGIWVRRRDGWAQEASSPSA